MQNKGSRNYIVFLAGLVAVLAALYQSQAAKDMSKTWTDPVEAAKEDPDFLVQGEYGSTKPGADYGVQVVALGHGKFDAYVLEDGLPGLGWVRGKGRFVLAGSREGDTIEFVPSSKKGIPINENYSGKIGGEKFYLKAADGEDAVLSRIERKSPTLGAKPPEGAVVLFDGGSADKWKNGKVEDGYLRSTGAMSKQVFGDYSLHLEFRTPYMPNARGQRRGNSGIYHSGRWETQVLDSFGLEGRDNQTGGIYSISRPRLNMCLPPLAWQTYDVDFTAARFDDKGKRIAWPRITVKLNGVIVHEDLELAKTHTTSAPIRGELDDGKGPVYLQDHNNPVVYRNIWVTTPNSKEKSKPVSFGMGKVELAEEKVVSGRKVLRYEHESYSAWGYAKPQRDYFNLVPSVKVTENVPLRVILHGAGKSGDKAMKAGLAEKEKLIHFYGDENYTLLYLDCRKNKENDWWWGYHDIKKSGDIYEDKLSPTEKRLLSTIEWVVENYDIDRNRIYLSGVSMGGSGSLGICRGDIFAAINVLVPAGVEHFLCRMEKGVCPEPAPVVNISSHVDRWSKGQEDFLDYMKKNRYLTIFGWSGFGHNPYAGKSESVVLEYPWLDIVKNEVYPVFTNASTDQEYPGFQNKNGKDQKGQINAYFRWDNLTDNEDRIEIELRLVSKDELEKAFDVPSESRVDVSLRRLQKFKVDEAEKYDWSMRRDGQIVQKGEVRADEEGLITIKGVNIEGKPGVLTVENK